MDSLCIGVSTQTPLLRFDPGRRGGDAPAPSGRDGRGPRRQGDGTITMARADQARQRAEAEPEPQPYLSPGGVCRMVLPTLRAWHEGGFLRQAHWLSLQPGAPDVEAFDGLPLHIHHLSLEPEGLAAYARTKEKLWADIHGLPTPAWDVEDFRFFTRYNAFNADALLDRARSLDVAYIHDFQLTPLGQLIGLAAPSVLRWHVPFDPQRIPRYTRRFLVRAMEDFDAVIVSTRRDLEGLVAAGFRGRAVQIPPHIDPQEWPDVPAAEVAWLEEEWGLGPDDPLLLCVARMDPMKRQDVAIEAMARLRRRHPRAKLVLVGNGSFSNKGGLGLGKADHWLARLEDQVAALGIGDHVLFTHWIDNDLLATAYARATAVILPSDIEGFGLTTLEAWRYRTVPVVSRGAGSAEVVLPGLNGETFPAGDAAALAEALDRLLADEEARRRQGEAGHETLRAFGVREAAAREREVLEEALQRFRDGG